MKWTIKHIEAVLSEPSSAPWTARWLNVLMSEAKKGFHPEIPPYGFGDPVSYGMISNAVEGLSKSGAARHGAECFNFYFPQVMTAAVNKSSSTASRAQPTLLSRERWS